MRAVPPFRGELGILLRYHAVAVRALPRPVLVAHEPGMEALYPDCDRLLVAPKPDKDKRWCYRHDAPFVEEWKAKWPDHTIVMPDKEHELAIKPWAPEPFEPQRNGAQAPDVVVCPRRRQYGEEKNWDGWPDMVDRLRSEGLRVFSAGRAETSYETKAEETAWDYDRPLDATIEAMQSARLVLATASGPSLLAVLTGAPLLLIASQGGLVAPGSARDENGNVTHKTYWKVPLRKYYWPLNHRNVEIEMASTGWQDPEIVTKYARRMLANGGAGGAR